MDLTLGYATGNVVALSGTTQPRIKMRKEELDSLASQAPERYLSVLETMASALRHQVMVARAGNVLLLYCVALEGGKPKPLILELTEDLFWLNACEPDEWSGSLDWHEA